MAEVSPLMVDIAELKAANERRWAVAKPTRNFISIAKSLVAAKSRYVAVQNRTGVPWYFIAIVHEREADQKWNTQLGQGDPLNQVSVHEPKGRGPFATWVDGAVDALVRCPPYAAHNTDWSIGGLLTEFEQYNGLGYAMKDLPSPYVWAGTDQYVKGKYASDGVYNPNLIDQQPGCAPLLICMEALDHSIVVGDPIIIMPESPSIVPDTKPIGTGSSHPASLDGPSITNPAKGSIGAAIANLFAAIFRRK